MTKRVLVVEDTDYIRQDILDKLTNLGYAHDWADCVENALDKLKAAPADLVISDGYLAGGTGPQLVRDLRVMAAKGELAVMPKVIGYTGSTLLEDEFRTMEVPVVSKYVSYPLVQVMALVQKLLAE